MTDWADPLRVLSEPSMPASETERVEHTRLRRRMLYGLWRPDLAARIRLELRSDERADSWGEGDLTGNIFRPTCQSLATLYAPIPPRAAADSEGGRLVLEQATLGGLWDLMVRVQRDTIGLREMLVRVEAVADPSSPIGWSLSYRPVYPDRVVAEPRPGCADLPGCVLPNPPVARRAISRRRNRPSSTPSADAARSTRRCGRRSTRQGAS